MKYMCMLTAQCNSCLALAERMIERCILYPGTLIQHKHSQSPCSQSHACFLQAHTREKSMGGKIDTKLFSNSYPPTDGAGSVDPNIIVLVHLHCIDGQSVKAVTLGANELSNQQHVIVIQCACSRCGAPLEGSHSSQPAAKDSIIQHR